MTITKTFRLALLSGAGMGLLGAAVPALAQAAAEEPENVADIVVTAQLRAQSLQDVPISVQVVSGDQIADLAADDISDIAAFIPGLEVTASSPTQPRYSIRGVSTSDFGVGTDPAVGVYIDGIYSGRSGAAVLAFNDIERIEVLKGPQGTLFGRNAAAGAVAVVTKKPSEKFEALLAARAGNFGKYRAEAMLNLPLGDTLALRVNGLYNERNGLFRNGLFDERSGAFSNAKSGERLSREKNWAARAQLAWRPSSETEVIASWTHDGLDQDARPAIGIVTLPDYPATPPVDPEPPEYINPFNAPLRNDVVGLAERRNLDEFTLRASHDFGGVELASITSYREFTTNNREDEDGTNRIDLYFDTNNREENSSFYQELRLSGTGDTLDWLVGVSYFDENADQVSDTFASTDSINTTLGNLFDFTPFTALEFGLIQPFEVPTTLLGLGWREAMINRGDYKAYAVFGDAIWHVTDRLNLTVGLRYTKDKKRFSWLNGPREAPELDAALALLDDLGLLELAETSLEELTFDVVFNMNDFATIACENGGNVTEGSPCVLSDSFSDISPRVVLDYRINDDVMVFASYAQGYKAGGFNSVQPGSRFTNEDVDNYEIGIKSQFRDLGLTLNTSVFRYIYKNRQSIRLTVPPGSVIPQYVTDTSDEQAWGADFGTAWSPRDLPLRLWANAQYIDATYKRRINSGGQDLSGEPTGTPKWAYSLGGSYGFELGNSGDLEFQVSHAYTGACRSNSESLGQGTCGGGIAAFSLGTARGRTDLRLQWTSDNERIEVGVFANNAFKNRYVEGVNNITAATLGTPFASLSAPRFYGADIRLKY